MNAKGTSYIELLVVSGIMGALMVAAGASYQGWMGGYKIEKGIKELYADLMHARLKAVQHNMKHVVVLNGNSYLIAEDVNENGQYDSGDLLLPNYPRPLEYTLLNNGSNNRFSFDARGLISQQKTLWFTFSGIDPDYDCITVSMSRIITGKYDRGNNKCVKR